MGVKFINVKRKDFSKKKNELISEGYVLIMNNSDVVKIFRKDNFDVVVGIE